MSEVLGYRVENQQGGCGPVTTTLTKGRCVLQSHMK